MSEECNPQTACEIKDGEHKKPNLDINDPRSYCFNIASKAGDVCLPKSCHIVKKDLKQNREDEKTEPTKEPTKLLPLKQAIKTCVPWKGPESAKAVVKAGVTANLEKEIIRDESGKIVQGNRKLDMSGIDTVGSKIREPQNSVDPLGMMGLGESGLTATGTVIGGVSSTVSEQADRETMSLARLVGIAQGPAAIMASFGDTETAKESLASIGAMSTGGALICECCECDPCICGPRGLNIENILAALKTLMGSGEDLNKLLGALGPGAMEALETIMGKETEAGAAWAAGGGLASTKSESEEAKTAAARGPVETASQIALREAWMRGDFEEMTSCHCLPGMCPCPGGHYVYKETKRKGKKDIDKKKKKKKIRKKVKKIGKDGKEYEEWDWATPSDSDMVSRLSETCVCPPTKHYLTPASSDADVSGRFTTSDKRIYWGDLMVCTCPRLQRTLAIIKPETVKFKNVVLRAIRNNGLDLLAERVLQLSPEEASEIYANFYGTSRFPNMVVSISQAPIIVLSLGGVDVVKIWNHIIGPDGTLPSEWFLPDWITREYGQHGEIVDALHGSRNLFTAENENRYFFPKSYIDPLMKNEADVKNYIAKNVNSTLLKGLTLLAKTRPIDPIICLAEFLLTHNPFQPDFPVNVSLAPV